MRKIVITLLLILCLAGCGQKAEETTIPIQEEEIVSITAKQAKEIMETEKDYIILDVRTEEEYAAVHIPDAICLPDFEVEEGAAEVLPDKDQLILVYCRSGRRSKYAARVLKQLGYTNVKEFGGIIDWPYETE